jgi:DNA-binding SARP family transcriptional activator/basic membrane lipoprotein Med (substrate-binding protein (PBP1-ABC) superfamily)
VTSSGRLEFRILGPLEARVDGERIALGGAKQRAVLAFLLLNANDVISMERLIDEVWGDQSPPSASHSLEAYVSRIRQLLSGYGPKLTRRGAGYLLELGDATLDTDTFVQRVEDAAEASQSGEFERASAIVAAALALWHGRALADVSLAAAGRAEVDRLEELKLRAHEQRFDAELELGRHQAVVGELQVLVGQNPYREHFVAQLMLALYRSGRQAEALETYEQLRRRLDADLGLQPSPELQQLSAQVVRQEPHLHRPETDASIVATRTIRPRARRLSGLVLAGALAAATMALTASGGAAEHVPLASALPVPAKRVALVLPRDPVGSGPDDPRIHDTTEAFRQNSVAWGYETEILVSDEVNPSSADIERTARSLESGGFAVVLVVGDGATAQALAPTVRKLTTTRFAFIDGSLSALSLEGVPNATGFRYTLEQEGRLSGYLSALITPRGDSEAAHVDVVSVVAAPRTPRIQRVVQAFVRGAQSTPRRVRVNVGYSKDVLDKTTCERIANEQIDAGSDVVLAMGGACARAALAVAGTRGVWGIRLAEDGVQKGPHILATVLRVWERSVTYAFNDYEFDGLPSGRDVELGLADEYAVDMWGESASAARVWSKLVKLCSSIRQHSEDGA